MSAKLRFLVPEATTNYVTNPSARFDTTGWSAFGSTITRTLDEARFGVASIKVVTDGAANGEGSYFRLSELDGVNDFVSGSVYVRGTGEVRLRLIDNPSGDEWVSEDVFLSEEQWERVEVLGRATGSDDFRLYVELSEDVAKVRTFYVDGAQVERQDAATTYCDGDQPGCRWDLYAHGSLSKRDAYTREGGRWVDVAGPSCEAQNLYMTVAGGLGSAPILNHVQSYADAPGGFYQSTKVQSRIITLSFHTKIKKRLRRGKLPTLEPLHKLRQELLDVVKSDKTGGGQAFLMEYQDGERALYLWVHYEGGLEGDWDVRNGFKNSFPLRLLAVSPFFFEDDQEVDALSFRSTQDINYILQRVNGEWSEMNGGFDDQVRAIEIGTRGEVIAVGDFIAANNNAGAVDPMIFANRIAYWDGKQWRGYGSGANNIIRAVAVAPNGYIYVTGDFTSIGGVAANRVAFWDGTWNAMGTGIGDVGRAIRVSSNGDVFVGGDFVTAGGNAAYYVARWNGSWLSIGANGGMNGAVYAISITDDGGIIYLGGAFTDEYGAPGILDLNYVASYEPAFLLFDKLGSGFDAAVRVLKVLPSGRLYAGGDFTEDGDAELTLLYVGSWNGAVWSEVGVGADNAVRDLAVSNFGSILLGGDFHRIGSTDALYVGWWNSTAYVSLDVEITQPVYAVALDKKENTFVAPNGTSAEFGTITTVENIGSAAVNPKIYILGPCTLRWIENQTIKKRVYTDIDVAENEEITIDFSKGRVESNVRGDLAYSIEPGSDLQAWTLMPGDNKIAVFMTDDVDAKMRISYVPRHWSADATVRVEGL